MKAPKTPVVLANTILQRFNRKTSFKTYGDPSLEKMFSAAAQFAASLNFIEQPYWLTLSGRSGVGKSHLAGEVFRQFMEQNRFEQKFDATRNRIVGNTAAYWNWRDVVSLLRGGSYDFLRDICNEWFVILDDVGSEYATGFIASALDQICDARVGKWFLMTTNLSTKEVAEKLDTRIASRMLRNNGVVIECNTVDHITRSRAMAGK